MILFYVINFPIFIPSLQYKSDTIWIYIFCRIYQTSFCRTNIFKGKVPPHHHKSVYIVTLIWWTYCCYTLDMILVGWDDYIIVLKMCVKLLGYNSDAPPTIYRICKYQSLMRRRHMKRHGMPSFKNCYFSIRSCFLLYDHLYINN